MILRGATQSTGRMESWISMVPCPAWGVAGGVIGASAAAGGVVSDGSASASIMGRTLTRRVSSITRALVRVDSVVDSGPTSRATIDSAGSKIVRMLAWSSAVACVSRSL